MFLWIWMLVFLSCIYLFLFQTYYNINNPDDKGSFGYKLILFILIYAFFLHIFGFFDGKEPEPVEVNYGIPLCPQDGLTYYEEQYTWAFESQEEIIQEFRDKNWTNIKVFERPSGGFFGGTDRFISGNCELITSESS